MLLDARIPSETESRPPVAVRHLQQVLLFVGAMLRVVFVEEKFHVSRD